MGAEDIFDGDGAVRPAFQPLVENSRCVAAAIPLLLKYQGTGKIHSVIQEYRLSTQRLNFEGCIGLVEFGVQGSRWMGKDWRHNSVWLRSEQPDINRGRGLVMEANRNEFYLVGVNFRLYLRQKLSLAKMHAPQLVIESCTRIFGNIVSAEEGHFNGEGEFIVDRRRNGDEIGRRGLWVESDIGVLHVITCD
jgi:hypothetical protein